MNRAEAAAAAAAKIPAALADAGLVGTDTPVPGIKDAIDDALRALGVAEASLSVGESDDVVGFPALVKHRALLMALGRMTDRFDVSVAGDAYRLSQAVAATERLIARTERELDILFGSAYPAGGGGVVSLGLNFLEPAGVGAW